MDLAAQEGRQEDIAPLADAASPLTHCFGLWPYETWSVRLQQALLTEDVEGGLTALEELLDTLDRPWVLGPLFRQLVGGRQLPSPPNSARPSSGNLPTRTILPMICSGLPSVSGVGGEGGGLNVLPLAQTRPLAVMQGPRPLRMVVVFLFQ